MKKQILCLSGWGQKFDSLEIIFKDPLFANFSVSSLNYSVLKSVEEVFVNLENNPQNPEIVIGWSLGEQLAVHAIEKKLLQPK